MYILWFELYFIINLLIYTEDEVLNYTSMDLENIVTPVNVDRLEQLLKLTEYDTQKTKKVVNGFRHGFSISYEGKMNVRKVAPNLQLHIGNETILWNKVMKEVKLGRYAGPFEQPPFEFFIQSPIGLVPKDNGMNTRLIFHLSYLRSGSSVNSEMPKEACSVHYSEFDEAVKRCIEEGVGCFISHSDFSAAFRNLGIKKSHWPLLLMKARSPVDKKWYFFIDKCLPFGASISCAHFQDVSDVIEHIVRFYTKKCVVNYLDDFLFTALLHMLCNQQVKTFLKICKYINFPVNLDKTFWGTTTLTFLGFLINTVKQVVGIPEDKIRKAVTLMTEVLGKRKITVHRLQKLCGFLNFICRAVVPGRAFTRCLYAHLTGHNLKPHHHLKVTGEMKADLLVWNSFLRNPAVYY